MSSERPGGPADVVPGDDEGNESQERTFPVHTPVVEKIEVVTRGDVRRAKLYYLRELRGKAAKIKEKREKVRD